MIASQPSGTPATCENRSTLQRGRASTPGYIVLASLLTLHSQATLCTQCGLPLIERNIAAALLSWCNAAGDGGSARLAQSSCPCCCTVVCLHMNQQPSRSLHDRIHRPSGLRELDLVVDHPLTPLLLRQLCQLQHLTALTYKNEHYSVQLKYEVGCFFGPHAISLLVLILPDPAMLPPWVLEFDADIILVRAAQVSLFWQASQNGAACRSANYKCPCDAWCSLDLTCTACLCAGSW
jgi:hypothetical protein